MASYTDITNNILTDKKVLNMYMSVENVVDQYDVSNRLFNQPHHFLDSADPILNSKVALGRKYMEAIASNSKIVYLLPGTTQFLPGYSDATKTALTDLFTGKTAGNENDNWALNELIGNSTTPTKYFSFMSDYSNYMQYVNLLCRAAAIFLGIGDNVGPDDKTKLKHYNWHNYKYKNFVKQKSNSSLFEKTTTMTYAMAQEALFGDFQYVTFYADVDTSATEEFSNSTQSSKLSGLLETGTDWMKELQFIQGLGDGDTGISGLLDDAKTSFSEIADKLAGSKTGVIGKILDSASDVLAGASIIFPEIWSDSEYSKSYSLTFNLVSPYGDIESIYLNVYVPMFHLLALTLPKQMEKSANSFTAPFLVRAFSKGWFSTQMAIIDRMSIEKNSWTVDGLPSSMKISISIKDLYNDLMMTPSTKPMEFFSNSGMMDFLAVHCGVDITKPQFILYIDTISSLLLGKVIDIPTNIFNAFIQNVRRITNPLYL